MFTPTPILVRSKFDSGRKPKYITADDQIIRRLRHQIACKLYRVFGSSRSFTPLGCNLVEFKTHLESTWPTGCNWDNWGKIWRIYWNPCAETKDSCHFSNAQPTIFVDVFETPTKGKIEDIEAITTERNRIKEVMLALFRVDRGARIRLNIVRQFVNKILPVSGQGPDRDALIAAIVAIGGQVKRHGSIYFVRDLSLRTLPTLRE